MRDCEIKPEVSDIGKGVKCASEEAARDREECDSEREGDVHLCCGLVARGMKDATTLAILVTPRRACCRPF